MNLLSNAIDAIEGPGSITIRRRHARRTSLPHRWRRPELDTPSAAQMPADELIWQDPNTLWCAAAAREHGFTPSASPPRNSSTSRRAHALLRGAAALRGAGGESHDETDI